MHGSAAFVPCLTGTSSSLAVAATHLPKPRIDTKHIEEPERESTPLLLCSALAAPVEVCLSRVDRAVLGQPVKHLLDLTDAERAVQRLLDLQVPRQSSTRICSICGSGIFSRPSCSPPRPSCPVQPGSWRAAARSVSGPGGSARCRRCRRHSGRGAGLPVCRHASSVLNRRQGRVTGCFPASQVPRCNSKEASKGGRCVYPSLLSRSRAGWLRAAGVGRVLVDAVQEVVRDLHSSKDRVVRGAVLPIGD